MTPLRLEDCGDTLTPAQLIAVLQVSRRTYQRWVAHDALPIAPIPKLPIVRFAKASVVAFLHGHSRVVSLRRSA